MTDAWDGLPFPVDFGSPAVASAYDEMPLWSAMFGLLMLRHLPLRKGMTVLDIGYGTGFPLLELAERLGPESKVYGIDPWETARLRAMEKARVWNIAAEPLNGDAADLPFPGGMFDLIVSNLGLNNFRDPQAAVRECARVAKPGARLALTTNLRGHMQEFYDVFAETLRQSGLDDTLPRLEAHIAHRATVDGVAALFEGEGFRLSAVQETREVMRFADGSALLRHHFIKIGFLDDWKAVVDAKDLQAVFSCLEAKLNRLAEERGELRLTIPMAYIEGEKV